MVVSRLASTMDGELIANNLWASIALQ
jgi:hypothetical protein